MAVGGAGADMLAIGGSVTVNSIANDVDSHISGGSNVSAAGNASVLANESATMLTAAGGIAVAATQRGAAVGAAIAYNYVGGGFNPANPDQTNPNPTTTDGITAYIDDSTVNVGGSLTVAAGFGPPSSLPGSVQPRTSPWRPSHCPRSSPTRSPACRRRRRGRYLRARRGDRPQLHR